MNEQKQEQRDTEAKGSTDAACRKESTSGSIYSRWSLQALWHGSYEYSNTSINLRQKFTISQDSKTELKWDTIPKIGEKLPWDPLSFFIS